MEHTKDQYDCHCTKPGCGCDHARCYKGWVDNDNNTTMPCLYCREETLSRLMRAAQAKEKGYPQEAVNRIMSKAKL